MYGWWNSIAHHLIPTFPAWRPLPTTPISATDQSESVVATLREVARRLSHQSRNAANAVAVNVEVLRSRLSRGNGGGEALGPFADRASIGVEDVGAGVNAVGALLDLMAIAAGAPDRARLVAGDPDALEIVVDGPPELGPSALRFAQHAGVNISKSANGVILKVLPVKR